MTAVFVHGVPETAAVWDPLVAALNRDDVATLALPGFGSELPEGFEPTKETYAAWLADELARFDEVDLVGHDWGGLLSMRVLADRPTNVRSWVLDTGDLPEDFRWHDTARVWQSPGDGEALIESWLAMTGEERGAMLESAGAAQPGARVMGESIDATMGRAILTLYRSATDIGRDWGPGIDRWQGPGLIIGALEDPFRSPRSLSRLVERTGAEVVELPGAGHWWMLGEPDQVAPVARALEDFWARL